jgi:hypothetical protein
VLERPLRLVSIVLTVVIAMGFLLFAIDELNRASNAQRSELAGYELADPSPAGERAREQRHSAVREYIDDANDILLKPFAGIDSDGGRWMARMVPTMIALLLYGFVIAYFARFMRGRG